ncbi:MAG: hypothetical protein M3R27_08395 [Bacteroidota bacterium]|nr:hypothetical protein [Bacteroidota bacterium]
MLFAIVLFLSESASSQDTIRVNRPDRYDLNCELLIGLKKSSYTDSIPLSVFSDDGKPEIRLNEKCTIRKKFDVFVSSFELHPGDQQGSVISSQSSFFSGPQKKLIRKLSPGDSIILKNIVIHAPDGFKKMEDLKIYLK